MRTVLLPTLQLTLLLTHLPVPTEAATAAPSDPSDAKCLTQKMLISCSPAQSPGVIACGGPTHAVPGSAVATATEVLLDWDHNASLPGAAAGQMSMAALSLELSKPSSDLDLVLLDLSSTGLCTGKRSGAPMRISFPAFPGPRVALRGLKLASVNSLSLEGNVVINADLLTGLPNLDRLVAVKNNVSLSPEPLARYAVSGAPSLTRLSIIGSIHSVAYGTPLLDSLASLQSVRISQSNLMLLKSGTFLSLPVLRYLYLTENNIRDLAPGSLSGLSSLEHLFLNSNGLRRIANYAFADLASLTRLSLANNRLSELQPNAFHGLASLQSLDLSENRLSRLPEILFAQLHSLQTLNLQRNLELRPDDGNDTFCPLEALKTVAADAPLNCERFGSARLVQLVGGGRSASLRRKSYACDISQIAPAERPCHKWLDRLAQQPRAAAAELPDMAAGGGGDRKQPPQLSVILLVIFGVICLIHVLTTAVTIYVCRRMRRRRRASLAQRKSPSSVSSPEEERSLDASPGVSASIKDSSVLGRLQSGNGAGKKIGDRDKDVANNRLNVRDKSYDFNEDENHA